MVDPKRLELPLHASITNPEILDLNFIADGHDDRTVDDVAELPNVSGPLIPQQFRVGFAGELQPGSPVGGGEVIEEKIDQHLNVGFPVAKGRDV